MVSNRECLSFAHLNRSWRLPAIEWSLSARLTYHLNGSSGYTMALTCQPKIPVPALEHRIAVKEEPSMIIMPPPFECIFICLLMTIPLGIIEGSNGRIIICRKEAEGSAKSAHSLVLRINKNPHRYRQQAGDYQVCHKVFFRAKLVDPK